MAGKCTKYSFFYSSYVFLKSIELHNFRSFSTGQFEFCPGVNIVFGPNASGKTNFLEAVHVLSNLRSFRTHVFRELVRWDEKQAYVRGIILAGGAEEQDSAHTKTLAVGINGNVRTPSINTKTCKSFRDYLRTFPSISFVPDDLSLIKGAPASRRYFLDKGTFLFHPPYWSLLTDYNKLLRQKNALLRAIQQKGKKEIQKNYLPLTSNMDAGDPCEIWNTQLQVVGSKIITYRLRFIQNIQRLIKAVYRRWLGTDETIDLQYKSSIGSVIEACQDGMSPGHAEAEQTYQYVVEKYEKTLQRSREREYRLGTAVIGPHRDDLEVFLAGKLIRLYGSQGQQRTAVLALKLAEVQLYFERYNEYPVLLLDDVTSELDVYRNNRLFESFRPGLQIFVTSTGKPDVLSSASLPVAHFDLSIRNT